MKCGIFQRDAWSSLLVSENLSRFRSPPPVVFRSAASSGEPPLTFESRSGLQLDAAMVSDLFILSVFMMASCPGLLGLSSLPGCWISVILLDKSGQTEINWSYCLPWIVGLCDACLPGEET